MSAILEMRTQRQAIAELSQLLSKHRVFCIRVTGAPGCGKTTLLEKTLAAMPIVRHAVVLSLSTIVKHSQEAATQWESITPDDGREAEQILELIQKWDLDDIDVLFVETGHISTPTLGEHATVTLLSATDGAGLPLNCPELFSSADVCLISKTDLIAETNFNIALAGRNLAHVRPGIEIIETSSVSGEGLNTWMRWAESRKRAALEAFALRA